MQTTFHEDTIMNHTKQTGFWKSACCLVFAFAGLAQAQTVERPVVQVGDQWKFETRDGWTKLSTGLTEKVISAVSENRIEVSENGSPAIYTSELNPVDTPQNRFDPPAKVLQFPFLIGSEWSYEGTTLIKAQGVTGRSQYSVKVVGQEKVTVPSGTYDAYKLVMTGFFTTRSSTNFTRNYWYAPSARAIVKTEHISQNAQWVSELTEASIKP